MNSSSADANRDSRYFEFQFNELELEFQSLILELRRRKSEFQRLELSFRRRDLRFHSRDLEVRPLELGFPRAGSKFTGPARGSRSPQQAAVSHWFVRHHQGQEIQLVSASVQAQPPGTLPREESARVRTVSRWRVSLLTRRFSMSRSFPVPDSRDLRQF